MKHRTRLLIVLAALLAVAPARATVRSVPVRVHIHESPRAAEAGQPYAATLRLEFARDGELSQPSLQGPGWRTELGVVVAGWHARGEIVELPFVATSSDPTRPLTLEGTFDGEPWARVIDLSPAAVSRAKLALSRAVDGELDGVKSVPAAAPGSLPGTGRADDFLALAESGGLPPAASKNAAETVRVTGQIAYIHESTGEIIGASDARVVLMVELMGGMMPDIVLTTVSCDDQGDFAVDIPVLSPVGDPRLYLVFAARNSAAHLQHTDIWEDTWAWASAKVVMPTSGTYGFGRLVPRSENQQGALHIANTILRGRAAHEVEGYYTNRVDVQWAETDGSRYNREWNELHIDRDDTWDEGVIMHEYGHYWMDIFAHQPDIDYCNDICDGGSCGHCIWCQEDQAIAWSEGFANFLSQVMTDHIRANYTRPSQVTSYNFQSIGSDPRCAPQPPPMITEGYFAAALYDMYDSADMGENTGPFPAWTDQLGGLLPEILFVASTSMPDDPWGRLPYNSSSFIEAFRARYPSLRPDYWETLMHNGFDLDTAPPSTPSGVHAVNHVVGTPSPDNTIAMVWDAGVDDFSGIGGYSYVFSEGSFAITDLVADVGITRSVISPNLAPGDWYFSIRAVDRAGNWSPVQMNFGPYTIREAEPANLEHYQPTGWQYAVVPRNDAGATSTSATVTSYLAGDARQTWWSYSGLNSGETTLPLAPRASLHFDGVIVDAVSFPQLSPGVAAKRLNEGPVTVRGGRHTFGMLLDCDEAIAEPIEIDNFWAHQWVWLPAVMANGSQLDRTAPPERNGGFEWIHGGSISYYNCDGFRTPGSVLVQAVWMYGDGTQTDYDLKLYGSTSNPDTGYQVPLETASRDVGCTDAILIHGLNDGLSNHHVGVSNWSGSDRDYHIGRTEGAYVSAPSSEVVSLPLRRMMYLRTVNVPSGTGEDLTFIVRPQAGSQPLHLAFFPHTFTTATLTGAAQTVTAMPGGSALLHVNVPAGSFAAVAVYRDPSQGTAAMSFDFECMATPPDLAAATPSGWHGNIVPQPDNAIAYPFTTVPAPATLTGSPGGTYLYMSETNQGPVAVSSNTYAIRLDGASLSSFTITNLAGGAERRFRGATPYAIPSGRHTLGVSLDAAGAVTESDEGNNIYGEQWMWTGAALPLDAGQQFAAPSLATAGFEDITAGLAYYNCRGLHASPLDEAAGDWAAVYAVAEAGVDVDLRLHEPYTSMSDGFTAVARASTWSAPECDFVVANFTSRPRQAYDVGVVNVAGSGQVLVAAVGTRPGQLGVGEHGPFALTNGTGPALHDVYLEAGWYEFRMQADAAADLGFSLYGPSQDLYGKDEVALDAIAWRQAAGELETFVAPVYETGRYCLAVWPVRFADARVNVGYSLSIGATVGVADELPAPEVTRLVAAAPNPFNPSTTIRYELAAPGEAVLEVFNLRGERVRGLVRGVLPAGRHEVVWDGRDERGGVVASGVYYARLRAADRTSLIKMTLLK